MDKQLRLLLVQLRSMQLFYHNCHNLISGPTFFADHGAFGDFYGQAESDYDNVAERAIGLNNEPLNLSIILPAALKNIDHLLQNYSSPEKMFEGGLVLEKELLKMCEMIDKNQIASSGTRQLVGDIANLAEARIYKIQQRLKKPQVSIIPPMSPLM